MFSLCAWSKIIFKGFMNYGSVMGLNYGTDVLAYSLCLAATRRQPATKTHCVTTLISNSIFFLSF